MGASESRPRLDDSQDAPKQGYHVVRVAAGSPAHLAGIEPFFDFCVGIDDVALDPRRDVDGAGNSDTAGLGAWKSLEEREGTQVILNVWNSKRQQLRQVPIVPSRQWSSQPPDSNASSTAGALTPSQSTSASHAVPQPSLLGLSLRLCNPSQALSHVWHILEILEGSPAESAGMVPFGDFVIGWPGGVLQAEGDFYDLVEAHTDRALRLYIYNADYDHTREVIIVPNREWGGEGLLGCGVGYGLLHRIPKPQDRPSVPPELDLNNENEAESTPKLATNAITGSLRPTGAFHDSIEAGNRDLRHLDNHEEHDDDQDPNTSGVTVSMRHDEDEDDD
ncbi:hypothetical protein BCV70DRAFT_197296 [Testicularia cyperi]|uniref:PDZ GRASP-type domain-containing protein n=1 Tax=Testicularia cyperi TaxID=1882483 RepID=A0A317XYP8_9BASI|nr:hypothetical protein BCV70DRAFT_197296 [Testicularia cyperi]